MKNSINDLNEKLNRKINLIREFEADIERERQLKRDVEK